MIAMSRAVVWGAEARRQHNVWEVLCRAALRGIDWAAEACGVKDVDDPVERAELLMSCGVAPEPHPAPRRPIDWARLDDFDRGRVARDALR